jgi:hypothetical protein
MIDTAFAEFGRLDVLVNNAAYQMSHERLDEFPTDEFDRTFRTNVYAMFWLCRAAVPRMKPGACIINTASRQAYTPSPELLAYAPTKAAIVNFTKALSQLAMQRGIRVNGEWLYVNRSPVGYTAYPYPVGAKGPVFHFNLEMNF